MEKVLILGASRGLGERVVYEMAQHHKHLVLVARKAEKLKQICQDLFQKDIPCDFKSLDISKRDDQDGVFQLITEMEFDRVVNVIGGGPYGNFQDKSWKDHEWALEVNFLFSAKLLHFVLKNRPKNLKQVVFTGSSVAEHNPDPMAASYCAGKHALKGLISSVIQEQPQLDIRLYSPPYMDTEMLPRNAWPRQHASVKVYDPKDVAQHMVGWILSSANDKFHFTYDNIKRE